MNKMKSTKKYQVPQVIDISGNIAIGQDVGPMGFCQPGSSPSNTKCDDGSSPFGDGTACSPTGNMPDWGKCIGGSAVAHGCLAGSAVNDF
ncbi:MAG: hypothetical protein RBS68_15965 [Anaerolineales bacterium]|jgi:hypothetical protein|nr:hypothetical protein [Anaerolineales bacterium]